jgi:flagellar protein FlgJ
MDNGFPLQPKAALAPLAAPGAAPAPAGDEDARYRAEATAAARKFESFFISQMLKDMRAGTRAIAPEGSVFKNAVNDDMQQYADSLVADQMAGTRAFGIADVILRQLLPSSSLDRK